MLIYKRTATINLKTYTEAQQQISWTDSLKDTAKTPAGLRLHAKRFSYPISLSKSFSPEQSKLK
ncbi:MAG TPA: hypothetical protein DHV16_11925 [Nitrospiraceae bacterium]|nr:hypothetical protein [Nitrospiraceae bacterium]HCL81738.1 hypothetical protein [Nitrospiraceae bacterium]HCZ12919.1 hypothetical protein [Nitrospiraceae bacterium]